MSRADELMKDMRRSGIIPKEKRRWEAKQANRVRPVIAPGQSTIRTASAGATASDARRQAIYAKNIALTEKSYADERARRSI